MSLLLLSLLLLSPHSTSPLSMPPNFITKTIPDGSSCKTRFPPEPNGYLHFGHAKSLLINTGVARDYPQEGGEEDGSWLLRLDDTNPAKESAEYVASIVEDVEWLVGDGYRDLKGSSTPTFTSDYFLEIHEAAVQLINLGLAYMDFSTSEELSVQRGTLTTPGSDSPFRTSSVAENLLQFSAMTAGEFPDGHCVLRSKIDMASPNMNLRDPVIYRLKRTPHGHHRTGADWIVFPMYDFSHPIVDSLENVTHSLCTLEFEDHRPFYDWVLEALQSSSSSHVLKSRTTPRQMEFSRLNLKHTVLSKRKLIQLVDSGKVSGWDDPRMPTISGVRRRGFTPASVKLLCSRAGVSKTDGAVDYGDVENAAREEMDKTAVRGFMVKDPLKVTLENFDGGGVPDMIDADRHPKDEAFGTRSIAFGRTLYIDSNDFFDVDNKAGEEIPKKFKRLTKDQPVRLKHAYVIRVKEVLRDEATGAVKELVCAYDDNTFGGVTPEGEKRAGIIHWIDALTSVRCEIREYDRLFKVETPGAVTGDFMDDLNEDSVKVEVGRVETAVAMDCLAHITEVKAAAAEKEKEEGGGEKSRVRRNADLHYQFERMGYYALDKDATKQALVFNRVVTLRDTWAVPVAKVAGPPRKRGAAKK